MKPTDFSAYYSAVHGYEPFPWQRRLAALACEDDWPDTLSLPTAAGKTSAIDVAVFALAYQAGHVGRTARLRTAFVVDRRVVVDEAHVHAQKIADALRRAEHPILAELAERLRRFAGRDAEPLNVALLRGGVHRDEHWAHAPDQPTIVVSTVDQVGSRLLFRGYGLSPRTRPIHAGLLGIDTRIVLDEAHISAPFEDTVGFVAAWQRRVERAGELPPPLALTRMTATPRTADAFGLDAKDRVHKVLARRLGASKPATAWITTDLEHEAAERAAQLVGEGKVVGVIVNRVAAARTVFEAIRARLGDVTGEHSLLLTGRARPFERDALLASFRERIFARPKRPSVGVAVVATQTVEVGANLDFDHLITELAPLDALRQRFGRLNRLANHDACSADILVRKESVSGRDAGKDPVYGDRLVLVWTWLAKVGVDLGNGRRSLDFGIDALVETVKASGVDPAQLSSVAPMCPVVLPAHVDAWTRTHPPPTPDPPIGPYLHGPGALDTADVTVIWRADLPHDTDEWEDVVAAVPPQVGEGLPLPRAAVVEWLEHGRSLPLTDLEGDNTEGSRHRPNAPGRVALRWSGVGDSEPVTPTEIRPGDTVVVPAHYGGVDRWGWNPAADAAATDIGDRVAHARDPGRAPVRLHPALLEPDNPRRAVLGAAYRALANGELDSEARDELREALLRSFGLAPSSWRLVRYAPLVENGDDVALLAVPRRGRTEFADDDDSPILGTAVDLDRHSRDVERWARGFAERCAPSTAVRQAIGRAGWLHDVGKADPRMQAWLSEGAPDPDQPLAKSGMDWRERKRNRAARLASGYPDGARHEFQSVAMIDANPAVLADVDAELVLHLVGTHHGFGRGLPPVVVDSDPVEVYLEHGGATLRALSDHGLWRIGSGWTDRFVRLQRAYGPWGLAWLEAVLRLADHRASEQEAEEGAL